MHSSVNLSFDDDLVHAGGIGETDVDIFVEGSGKIFAYKIRFDGKLAMTAVDKDSELNAFWPAKIVERIHCGANSSPAEQHVVHQHNDLAGDIERNRGR